MTTTLFTDDTPASTAQFSPCRKYRYLLTRTWDASLPRAMFVGLNPSTADETQDDPTIRRCIGYAKAWGYGGLVMCNLFAFRATDPRVMKAADEPVGPDNDAWLASMARDCGVVVAAWGTHGLHRSRGRDVWLELTLDGANLKCLALTKDGAPGHPLYLKADLKPVPFGMEL